MGKSRILGTSMKSRFLVRLEVVSAVVVLALFPATLCAAVPAWISGVTEREVPAEVNDAHAVILLDEGFTSVDKRGRVTESVRKVVRILDRDGAEHARAEIPYDSESSKMSTFLAYVLSPSGKVKTFGKRDLVHVGQFGNSLLYTEQKLAMLSAEGSVEPGSIFAFECTIVKKSDFTEFMWVFQSGVPTLESRATFEAPEGWIVRSHLYNHEPVEPRTDNESHTWVLRDLPGIAVEPMGPAVLRVAPHLVVELVPPDSERVAARLRNFQTWDDVSNYIVELHEPQLKRDAQVENKTRELTGGLKTDWEKIAAIAKFVQDIRYISIFMGAEQGGGYRPRTAAEVFACEYGDCKDKTTLMRSMLEVAGIKSYPVVAYWGDRAAIREEWPTPRQFNHCIIAVSVGENVDVPTVIDDSVLGSLLFFDPTDEQTPLGDLDYNHQGSLVLVAAADGARMVRLPFISPESNILERSVKIDLRPDGSMSAVVDEKSRGQEAVRERRIYRSGNSRDYERIVQGWITQGAGISSVSSVVVSDEMENGRFSVVTSFKAREYAKPMGARLLMFKPVVVERRRTNVFRGLERKHPMLFEPAAFNERTQVVLPDGFVADEMPDSVSLDKDFATYVSSGRVEDGTLIFERSLRMHAVEVPAARHEEVREFFDTIVDAEQVPVVLAKP